MKISLIELTYFESLSWNNILKYEVAVALQHFKALPSKQDFNRHDFRAKVQQHYSLISNVTEC
jgi:hypothetical protein